MLQNTNLSDKGLATRRGTSENEVLPIENSSLHRVLLWRIELVETLALKQRYDLRIYRKLSDSHSCRYSQVTGKTLARSSLQSSRFGRVKYSFLNQLSDEASGFPLLHLLLVYQSRDENCLLDRSGLPFHFRNSLDHSLERVSETTGLTRHYHINIHRSSLDINPNVRE